MRRTILFLLISFLLVACGTRKGQFKFEGRFLHMNQGQLFVYSPDGAIVGMDTIEIKDGRFAYQIPATREGTLVIVFPNYSRQPVFVESGGSVEIKADASHLKEMEVKGTDANDLMTDFRKQIASVSPPEEVKNAVMFIKDHPESIVSVYLLNKYIIETDNPDYRQALSLVNTMLKAQPKNGDLVRLKRMLGSASKVGVGSPLPSFSAKTIDGRTITNNDLNAQEAVIYVWSSWDFESQDIQRILRDAAKNRGAGFKALGICVDPSMSTALRMLKMDNINFPIVCDGQMMDGALLHQLGLSDVPDNIILKNGRVSERGVNIGTMRQRFSGHP